MKNKCLLTIILIVFLTLFSQNNGECLSQIYDSNAEKLYLGGLELFYAKYYQERIKSKKYYQNLYVIDTSNSNISSMYNSSGQVRHFSVHDSGYIVAMEHAPENSGLRVFNANGEKIFEFKGGVFSTSPWSPDGKKIVFETVRLVDRDRSEYQTEEVWIFDIEKDELKMIFNQPAWPYWYPNNEIYLNENYAYDFGDRKLVKERQIIPYHTNNNRTLYIKLMIPADQFARPSFYLFDMKSHKQLMDLTSAKYNRYIFVDNEHILKYSDQMFVYQVYNISQRKVIYENNKNGSLLGWNADMTRAVVYVGKDTVQIQAMLTGQVLKSFKLPE